MQTEISELEDPQSAWGVTSLVLGMIGLVLFFLPILGGPISSAGLMAGLIGWSAASIWRRGSLRWSVGGSALSSLALAMNLAIAFAPAAGLSTRDVPPAVQMPDHAYIPPPSRFDN